MSPIKVLLILMILFAFAIFFAAQKNRLIFKLFLILLLIISIIFVIFPNITNCIANFLGVGRGVDFVIYINIASLYIIVIILYKKIKELDVLITKLTRNNALHDALKLKKDNK
jgi:small membrane protein